MQDINITSEELQDAFKRLRSARQKGKWSVPVKEYTLENSQTLDRSGNIIYWICKGNEVLMQGNHRQFKKLMN